MPGPESANQYDHANTYDLALSGRYEAREADWRNGAVSYQVFVDRFAPSADLAAKAHLYPAPKVLKSWDEQPVEGPYLDDEGLYAHEIEFWGGDLASVQAHLDYITSLGADVLYLNPIHLAYTNHKYDALDYAKISPEYGTEADLRALAAATHDAGMRLVLDGVFNHMGRNSEYFRSAAASPDSPYREWFVFGDEFPGGARTWRLSQNLPENNLEKPAYREFLFSGQDSIIRQFLRLGADGWRLDVAMDIGFRYLDELTAAAHDEKPDSLVIGEISPYPKEWFPSVDGLIMFGLRLLLLEFANGNVSSQHAVRMLQRIYTDCDFEHLLKSWVYLDNHDTARVATRIPDLQRRRIAQVLQFTLPGSPNLYYGSELGMSGGDDPEMRAPMRWDLVSDENPDLAWITRLIEVHKQHRALRVGDLRWFESDRLVAFERYTDRVEDAVVVIINPTDEPIEEFILMTDSKLMDPFKLLNLLDPAAPPVVMAPSSIKVEVAPRGALVLAPEIYPEGGFTPYKRVQ